MKRIEKLYPFAKILNTLPQILYAPSALRRNFYFVDQQRKLLQTLYDSKKKERQRSVLSNEKTTAGKKQLNRLPRASTGESMKFLTY